MWFRQIAQLSTTISQAQRATAFHFFTSNLFLLSPPSAGADFEALTVALDLDSADAAASAISTSAMFRGEIAVEDLLRTCRGPFLVIKCGDDGCRCQAARTRGCVGVIKSGSYRFQISCELEKPRGLVRDQNQGCR